VHCLVKVDDDVEHSIALVKMLGFRLGCLEV